MNNALLAVIIGLVLVLFGWSLARLKRKHKALREKAAKPLEPKSPEPCYGVQGSPVTGHIRFKIDKVDGSKTFLELDGQRIRFLKFSMESWGSSDLPVVTISVYARLVEGEIKGATGAIEIIHIDESTIGKTFAPKGGKENCPYTKSAYACPMLSELGLSETKPPQANGKGGCPAGVKTDA